MIIDKETKTTKYILPFLFENKAIFNENTGFVNAYVEDINRPYVENCIFVVFKYTPNSYGIVDEILTGNKNFYNKYNIYIDNVFYIEYAFTIPNDKKITIDVLINGYNCISSEDKTKISNFWKYTDYTKLEDLYRPQFSTLDMVSLRENEIVTEEDYIENSDDDIYDYLMNLANKKAVD